MRGKTCKKLRKAANEVASLVINKKLDPVVVARVIYRLKERDLTTTRTLYKALKRNVTNHTLSLENGVITKRVI